MIGSGKLTKQIAGYLARTGYEALNDDALRATKDHILYTLGTIVAGSSAPGIKQALAGGQALSGSSSESTVLVQGEKLRYRRGTLPQLRRRLEDHRRPFVTLRTGIEDPPVIVKILSHLGRPTRGPPRTSARRVDLFQTI